MFIKNINDLIEKQNNIIKVIILTLPFILLTTFYFTYIVKESKLLNIKKKDLIYLENEYNNIVKNNSTFIELNESKKILVDLEKEINDKSNLLYDNFKLYHWEEIDKKVKENFLTSNIYSKNEKEIMLYGKDSFLNIYRDLTIFEKRYSKYKIDFFSYNAEEKSYKIKILNINGEK